MKNVSIVLLLLISITGCSVSSPNPIELSHEGPTMKQNYDDHISGRNSYTETLSSNSNVIPSGHIKRELDSDINSDPFSEARPQRIQNPELEMFVYPHRSTRQGVIVPGYSVSFPMYEKVHYGLVGDLLSD